MKHYILTLLSVVILCVANVAYAQPNPTLQAIPANTVLELSKYACNQPTDGPFYCQSNTDDGGIVYDKYRHQVLVFGGGHSATYRNDLEAFSFSSLTWGSLYPSTLCKDMTLANVDQDTHSFKSDGNPISRHNFDMHQVTETEYILVTINWFAGGQKGCQVDPPAGAGLLGKIAHYNFATKKWSYGPTTVWHYASSSEYDPVSKKIVILGQSRTAGAGRMHTYDPATRVINSYSSVPAPSSHALGATAATLVYFPPNQKMYLMGRNGSGRVWEVTLNRADWGKSTIVLYSANPADTVDAAHKITGPIPASFPTGVGSNGGSTGYDYDDVNQIIGGGITMGVFSAYDPIKRTFTASKMNVVSPSKASADQQAFHAIAYDQVDKVFIYRGDNNLPGGSYTWAYRYAAGGPPPPPPPPPNVTTEVQTRTVACQQGMTGTITQTRTVTTTNGVADNPPWVNTSNTCVQTPPPPAPTTDWKGMYEALMAKLRELTGTASAPPPVVTTQVQNQQLACPAGQTGAILQTRTVTTTDGKADNPPWTTKSNTCVAGPVVPPVVTPPVSSADFDTRCKAAGVVRCSRFDTDADMGGNQYGAVTAVVKGTANRAVIDQSVKASGSGSLKFTIPSNSGSNSSGTYSANFSDDLTVGFAEGETFYVQWRQRFSPEMFQPFKSTGGGFTGWKQVIIGAGDKPGCTPSTNAKGQCRSSCTALETVVVNENNKLGPQNFPIMYHSCNVSASHGPYVGFYEKFPPGSGEYKLQNAMPAPYCLYSQSAKGINSPPGGNCFKYAANEWMTFQIEFRIGKLVTTAGYKMSEWVGSNVRLWVAREGQPSVLVIDFPVNLNAGMVENAEHFGKVWLLPYMTNKDPAYAHPAAYTWYDDLIVSRSRIADPT